MQNTDHATRNGTFSLGSSLPWIFPVLFVQNNEISVIMKFFGTGPKSHAGANEKLVIYFQWAKEITQVHNTQFVGLLFYDKVYYIILLLYIDRY